MQKKLEPVSFWHGASGIVLGFIALAVVFHFKNSLTLLGYALGEITSQAWEKLADPDMGLCLWISMVVIAILIYAYWGIKLFLDNQKERSGP
jgi:hypothetical protein